jgi:hypothetical protein
VWESLVLSNKELETTFIQATDGTIIEPPDHQPFDATPSQDETPSECPEGALPPSATEGVALSPNVIPSTVTESEDKSLLPPPVTPASSP